MHPVFFTAVSKSKQRMVKPFKSCRSTTRRSALYRDQAPGKAFWTGCALSYTGVPQAMAASASVEGSRASRTSSMGISTSSTPSLCRMAAGSKELEINQSDGLPMIPSRVPRIFRRAASTSWSKAIRPLTYPASPCRISPFRPRWRRKERISIDAARELLFPEVSR